MPPQSPSTCFGEESETIEEVYEPYLIQLGFLHRSPRGRVATEGALWGSVQSHKFLCEGGGAER